MKFQICACECDKICEIDEYLSSCTKHFDDNLIITCEDKNSNTNTSSLKIFPIYFLFLLIFFILMDVNKTNNSHKCKIDPYSYAFYINFSFHHMYVMLVMICFKEL